MWDLNQRWLAPSSKFYLDGLNTDFLLPIIRLDAGPFGENCQVFSAADFLEADRTETVSQIRARDVPYGAVSLPYSNNGSAYLGKHCPGSHGLAERVKQAQDCKQNPHGPICAVKTKRLVEIETNLIAMRSSLICLQMQTSSASAKAWAAKITCRRR